jgi:hypothetical protein
MKDLRHLALLMCVLSIATVQMIAQGPNSGGSRPVDRNPEDLPQEQSLKIKSPGQASAAELDSFIPNVSRGRFLSLSKEVKRKIKIEDAEKAALKEAVNDKKANLLRMLTSLSCSTSRVVDVSDPRCAEDPEISFVSQYSLRLELYGENVWMDIALSEDEIIAGNKWHTQGLMIDLGDRAMGEITNKSAEAVALWQMPRVKTVGEKAAQGKELESGAGIKLGELVVKSRMKLAANRTYLVRTTSYGLKELFSINESNLDTLYAVRVLEMKPDRVITLAWKKLEQKFAPTLKD